MIAINISNRIVKLLELKKTLFGGYSLGSLNRLEIKEGEKWEEKLLNLHSQEKVVFSIPDSKIFLHRFEVSDDIKGEELANTIIKKVREAIPVPVNHLILDSAIVNHDKNTNKKDILLIAATRETILSYYKRWQKLNIEPELILPESLAIFEMLKNQIKEEIVLYINIEDKESNLIFLDKFAPILSLSQAAETKKFEGIKQAIEFLTEKYSKNVTIAILNGEESTDVDVDELSRKIGIPVTKADKILQNRLEELKINLNETPVSPSYFLNTIGMGIAAFEKETLNLSKKNLQNSTKSKSDTQATVNTASEKSLNVSEKEVSKQPAETVVHNKIEKVEEDIDSKKADDFWFEPPNKSSKKYYIVGLIVSLLLLLSLFGYMQYGETVQKMFLGKSGFDKATIQEPVVKKIGEPTSLPTPILLKETLKIQVQNGNGRKGEAKVAVDLMESKGYQNIQAKNADSYDYTETVIQIKESKKEYLETLVNDLKEKYNISSQTVILEAESGFDAIVIIGNR